MQVARHVRAILYLITNSTKELITHAYSFLLSWSRPTLESRCCKNRVAKNKEHLNRSQKNQLGG